MVYLACVYTYMYGTFGIHVHLLVFTIYPIMQCRRSLIELVQDIFMLPESQAISQWSLKPRSLEKHFGCLHQQGRANQNPTAAEALKSMQTLRVIDSVWIDDITGNCRGRRKKRKFAEAEDSQPLPKRQHRRPSIWVQQILYYVNKYSTWGSSNRLCMCSWYRFLSRVSNTFTVTYW